MADLTRDNRSVAFEDAMSSVPRRGIPDGVNPLLSSLGMPGGEAGHGLVHEPV